ncbi:MAG: BamA/TamA family outer membrane protein [Candidatus Eisenbacteria bacterium]|nr:BamA/TamA family outer membrane protein [Candidatus Eisenbacteria bacterium]
MPPARAARGHRGVRDGRRGACAALFLLCVATVAPHADGEVAAAQAVAAAEPDSALAMQADTADQTAAPPPSPTEIRGRLPRDRSGLARAARGVPRALLFPLRAAVYVAAAPARWIAGTLDPILPLDRIWHGLRRDRYFIPTIGVDPEWGANAGFRAATGNPLHGGSAITYRVAYGGAHAQVYALTFRSADDQLTPYRSGWGYTIRAKYENTAHHPHFGIGNDSSRDSLSFYDLERFVMRGTLHYAPWRRLRCDLTVAETRTAIARAHELPSDEVGIGERFPESVTVLGPATDPQKRWYEAALLFDARNERGRPTAGFRGEIYYARAQGAGDDTTRFSRYGLEAQGYVPLGERHTLVVRLAGEEIDRGDADSLHFSDLLTLGGRSSLRGFYEDRFAGYATVLATLEYRIAFSRIAELCLFVDAGETVPKLTDPNSPLRMNFDGVHYAYGAGLRYATHDLFCLRGFAAYSEEDLVFSVTLESAFAREDRRERR